MSFQVALATGVGLAVSKQVV